MQNGYYFRELRFSGLDIYFYYDGTLAVISPTSNAWELSVYDKPMPEFGFVFWMKP